MEMEHINENTIRVLINDDDLEERGITMLDLLSNQSQIESFFYSILEEVDIDDSFMENDMITFQVIPNHSGLELYISKDGTINANPYAKYMNQADDLEDELDKMQATTNKEHTPHSLKDYAWLWNDDPSREKQKEPVVAEEEQIESVFVFNDFEEVIEFASHVKIENGLSFLHALGSQYFVSLIQFTAESLSYTLEAEKAAALEFGEESQLSLLALEEYGKQLMKGNALELIRSYFVH